MSEFSKLQQQLDRARRERAGLKHQLLVKRESLTGLREKYKLVVRQSGQQEREGRTASLKEEIASLERQLEEEYILASELDRKIEKLLSELALLESPEKAASRMDDSYPLLLFPVRLETRFKTTDAGKQLWVRVYPDDCNVAAREELLTTSELLNGRIFWTEMWKAGGIEQLERGAWRALVDSHGAGRSSWIIKKYSPDTSRPFAGKPSKENNQDIILTVLPGSGDELSGEDERMAAEQYWIAVYRAAGDSVKQQEAFSVLADATGDARAQFIDEHFRPVNLEDDLPPSISGEEANIRLALLYLADPTGGVSQESWTTAPVAVGLPDRFVAICYTGNNKRTLSFKYAVADNLALGPDPGLPEADQIEQKDGDLKINKELEWMVDFEKAEQAGMATKIPLDQAEASRGFDRLVVLGLRLSSGLEGNGGLLEELFESHYHSSDGMGIIRQGTPTNNTGDGSSGYSWIDDADESYDRVIKRKEAFLLTGDYEEKSDGQVLAEYLGLPPGLFHEVPHAAGKGRSGAIAMNRALFPATLGYFMEEMMHPVFSERDIESTRMFHSMFVSGRGPLPALRIGTQPYGIYPATVFSRIQFDRGSVAALSNVEIDPHSHYLQRLHALLMKMDETWTKLVPGVSYTGKEGDSYKILLDVLGLHSGSVEFHQRYSQTLQHLYNKAALLFTSNQSGMINTAVRAAGEKLLEEMGFDIKEVRPAILDRFFLRSANPLTGPLIDDRPLSETEPVRAWAGDKNYIEWLLEESLENIRKQNFGPGNQSPNTLLYLLLRHALMQSVSDAGAQMMVSNNLVTGKAVYHDPPFINIQAGEVGKSKFEHLYSAEESITGSNNVTLAEHIYRDEVFRLSPETMNLRALYKALETLKDTPTAALERLLAEHLDTCSYRLDAWKTGLVHYRMFEQLGRRKSAPDSGGTGGGSRYDAAGRPGTAGRAADAGIPGTPGMPGTPADNMVDPAGSVRGDATFNEGIHLGAWGWLHDVRPTAKTLDSVTPGGKLDELFNKNGQPPLQSDSSNLGFIHAPSLNQAATAAILRNAWVNNASKGDGNPFGVNLSSDRVRMANSFLEGLRNGQSLSALLGYQFERGLHDGYSLGAGEVDKFIYPLRKKFPLVADKLKSTQTSTDDNEDFVEEDNTESIEAIEARNVIDGLRLINHVKKPGKAGYPFGFPVGTEHGRLPVATTKEKEAIDAEVDRIMNIHDAISDMVIAEEVYQVVQGNIERAAGSAEAFSKGSYPPEIEVVNTPRSGVTLTQRVAIHFEGEASGTQTPYDGSGGSTHIEMTPCSAAEPAINLWLAGILPDPALTACLVTWSSPLSQNNELMVSQKDLGLQPIDLVRIFDPGMEQSMSALDDLIVSFIKKEKSHHPNTTVEIRYSVPLLAVGDVKPASFFELGTLLGNLRKTLTGSRSLQQSDMSVPTGDDLPGAVYDNAGLAARLNGVIGDAGKVVTDLDGLLANADASGTGALANDAVDIFTRAALLTREGTGSGFIHSGINAIYLSFYDKLHTVIERWDQKIVDYDAAMDFYEAAATGEEKIQHLRVAEGTISTAITGDPGSDHAAYKAAVELKKTAFDLAFNTLISLRNSGAASPEAFLAESSTAIAPMAVHDLTPFDPESEGGSVEREEKMVDMLKEDIKTAALNLREQFAVMADEAKDIRDTALADEAAGSLSGAEAAAKLAEAAKKLLGEDAIILPRFTLPEQQAEELHNTYENSSALLDYVTDKEGRVFPVDDWLYGTARVRENLGRWENITILAGAFNGGLSPELTPMQLPFVEEDRWLAMRFRDEKDLESNPGSYYRVDSDKLLYTAHHAVPFSKDAPVCGILLDEWTELIPEREETTGLAFHYDQPGSEPPQSMLFLVPPVFTGNWKWDDIVETLEEIFEDAKKRAVEPDRLGRTAYGHFLPATMMAVTLYWITMATNLAINNDIYRTL